ncbi:MAG: phytochelatin synthase family protein [Rhizobiales bacterium]|nr:phytochelatin synthase family protein [Hyphomicrobiales bacterium]
MRATRALIIAAALAAGLLEAQAETLPLPDSLIAYDNEEGQALLLGAEARNDFFPLSSHFVNQINPAFCGPASISMVLNALDVPRPPSPLTLGLGLFDQENVFTPATEAVKPKADILNGGMTLDQLGGILAAHGLKADVHHAADASLDAFRTAAVEVIGDGNRFILVNYLRSAIGQEKGGHISPLGAYDADTDRFLILDVSQYKYPPVWVEAKALFGAMDTVDSDGGKTRGYVVVGK